MIELNGRTFEMMAARPDVNAPLATLFSVMSRSMISAMLGTITLPHTRKGFWPVGSGNENAAFSFSHHVHALTGRVTTAVGCFKNLQVGFVATTSQLCFLAHHR